MCGILGIYKMGDYKKATEEENILFAKVFTKILEETESRGKDATGVALILEKKTGNNELIVYKDAIAASDFIRTKSYKKFIGQLSNTRFCIGHCRLKTKGSETKNKNNHPQYNKKSGFAIVHNGSISNDDEIFKETKIDRVSEVDSEIILRLVESIGIKKAVKKLQGSFTFAAMNANKPDELCLYKNRNPLYIAYLPKYKWIIFSSSDKFIESALIVEDKIFDYFPTKRKITTFILQIAGIEELITITPDDFKVEAVPCSTEYSYTNHNNFDDSRYENRSLGYNTGTSCNNFNSNKSNFNTRKKSSTDFIPEWKSGKCPGIKISGAYCESIKYEDKVVKSAPPPWAKQDNKCNSCDNKYQMCGFWSGCVSCVWKYPCQKRTQRISFVNKNELSEYLGIDMKEEKEVETVKEENTFKKCIALKEMTLIREKNWLADNCYKCTYTASCKNSPYYKLALDYKKEKKEDTKDEKIDETIEDCENELKKIINSEEGELVEKEIKDMFGQDQYKKEKNN